MNEALATINPYWGKNFFEFLGLLFNRAYHLIKGDLLTQDLTSDEIQVSVLVLVAISCALVGSLLVLKRMTMLANSLSHTILLGIVIAYIIIFPAASIAPNQEPSISIQVLLLASLLTGLITTLLTQLLTNVVKLQEDASIGLVFTTLFAIGIVLVTMFTRNLHIGTEVIMGNVDALHFNDLKLIATVALIDFLIVTIFFKEFKITTFDPALANSLGISTNFFNYLLMILIAATSIGAFRAVGVLLVLAFLVGPVLTARLLTDSLKMLIFLAVIIGSACSICGVALSRHMLSVYHMPLSTAGLVVVIIALAYLLAIIAAPKRGLVVQMLQRRNL